MTEAAGASHLNSTRASYDTVAVDYNELITGELDDKPCDRAMLAAFAEVVTAAGTGLPVADVGCGPGRVTVRLDALGVEAFGIDLSPGMIAVAREAHPGLRFDVGSMLALDLDDEALGGVLAWYSLVHTPEKQLPDILAEFERVLAPGGHLLLAFKVGDGERVRLEHAYGHPVDLHVYRQSPDRVAKVLVEAGSVEVARLVRAAVGGEKSPQAFLLVRKPGRP